METKKISMGGLYATNLRNIFLMFSVAGFLFVNRFYSISALVCSSSLANTVLTYSKMDKEMKKDLIHMYPLVVAFIAGITLLSFGVSRIINTSSI